MTVAETAKNILEEQGRTQTWVVKRMNEINPELSMDSMKLSTTLLGKRKMSGDELIAFCKALEVNPDIFLQEAHR